MCASYNGDLGFTDLISENGISKDDLRLEAIGAVDEAWSALGFARSLSPIFDNCEAIYHIQKDLYILMSQLAGSKIPPEGYELISENSVAWLESKISEIESEVIMPTGFITSGETTSGGILALTRSIVRRAERRVVTLTRHYQEFDPILIKYLNRLSSLCFMMELREYS
jgi:cob(I)alamin adenosyltransferase